jgi:hypothetical protein
MPGVGVVRPGHALAIAVAATCGSPACVRDYRPPDPREPHALVTVRLDYRAWPSEQVEQRVDIDGRRLRDLPEPARQGSTVSRKVPVRPGATAFTVQAIFFHNDVTSHAETYDTTEQAPCGSTTCTQIVPHTRLVSKTDRVDDASCSQALKFQASAGESYVLSYTFLADQRCTLECSRLLRARGTGVTKTPCPGQRGGS